MRLRRQRRVAWPLPVQPLLAQLQRVAGELLQRPPCFCLLTRRVPEHMYMQLGERFWRLVA